MHLLDKQLRLWQSKHFIPRKDAKPLSKNYHCKIPVKVELIKLYQGFCVLNAA